MQSTVHWRRNTDSVVTQELYILRGSSAIPQTNYAQFDFSKLAVNLEEKMSGTTAHIIEIRIQGNEP